MRPRPAPNAKRNKAVACQNLLHTIRLTDPYAQPQVRTCVSCGQEVFLDVQVYPLWLTAMLRDPRRDALDRPVGLGAGYAGNHNEERAWERLKDLYAMYHPKRSNTDDESDEDDEEKDGV